MLTTKTRQPVKAKLKPARKPGGPASVTYMLSLTLVVGRDDDIIAALQGIRQGRLAGIIREMMRTGVTEKRFKKLIEMESPEESFDGGALDVDL